MRIKTSLSILSLALLLLYVLVTMLVAGKLLLRFEAEKDACTQLPSSSDCLLRQGNSKGRHL